MDLFALSRIFFALIAVIALIGVLALLARKAGFVNGAISMARRRRLAVSESLPIDARRRAVILRCDGREHLIVLGPTGETLIDADLPAPAALPAEEPAETPPFVVAMQKFEKAALRNPFAAKKEADAA